MKSNATEAIRPAGGKVIDSVRSSLRATDLSSYLLQVSSSGAKVIGLASVGGDTMPAIKQTVEFGIGRGGQLLAAFLVFISDIHALGLEAAQGLYTASGLSSEARQTTGRQLGENGFTRRRTGATWRPNAARR